MSRTPKLEDVIEDAINSRLETFWTAIPARIKSYDFETQTASVTVVITNATEDGAGVKRWLHPTISNVPVMFPGSSYGNSTGFGMTFPLRTGGNGLYIVSTLPTGQWRSSSNETHNVDDAHGKGTTNHLESGFFIPAETRGAKLESENNALIIQGDHIKIGGKDGTESTIMGDTFKSDLNSLLTSISTYLAAIGTATGVSSVTVTGAITSFKNAWANRLSTKTKVK